MLKQAVPSDYPGMHRVRLAVRENTLSSPGRVTEADYLDAMGRLGRSWVVEEGWALVVHQDHEGRINLGTS